MASIGSGKSIGRRKILTRRSGRPPGCHPFFERVVHARLPAIAGRFEEVYDLRAVPYGEQDFLGLSAGAALTGPTDDPALPIGSDRRGIVRIIRAVRIVDPFRGALDRGFDLGTARGKGLRGMSVFHVGLPSGERSRGSRLRARYRSGGRRDRTTSRRD